MNAVQVWSSEEFFLRRNRFLRSVPTWESLCARAVYDEVFLAQSDTPAEYRAFLFAEDVIRSIEPTATPVLPQPPAGAPFETFLRSLPRLTRRLVQWVWS